MHQRSWFGASVLGAVVATVSFACSSGDSQGTPQGAGAAASGGSAIGGSASAGGTANATSGAGGNANQAGAQNAAGTATSGGTASGGSAGQAAGGTSGNPSGGSTNAGGSGGAAAGGGGSSAGSGGSANGAPTADQLLAKLGACTKVKGPFNPDEPGSGDINVCKAGNALWWKADMDVDCDGIQTSPCDTDVTGQPQTSILDLGPSGDVDPTKLPYFVIPLGTPETEWYTAYDVDLGQIGAIIYKGQVIYGIFADQAGGNFIGEASYKMCSLFIGANNCDPNNGGIDPQDVTYITFGGTAARASGKDIYDHDKHTAIGEAAAKAWLAQ